MAKLSMAHAKRKYEKFRRLYYSDVDMPASKDLEWEWMDHPQLLGQTLFDDDGDAIAIRLHQILRSIPRLLSVILLHEMSHVRNPRADHGPWWRREALRLGQIGAMREFF